MDPVTALFAEADKQWDHAVAAYERGDTAALDRACARMDAAYAAVVKIGPWLAANPAASE